MSLKIIFKVPIIKSKMQFLTKNKSIDINLYICTHICTYLYASDLRGYGVFGTTHVNKN